MKRFIQLFLLWFSVLILNSCVAVRYPEGYSEWPDEQQSEWRENHPLRPWERFENGSEEEEDQR